MQKETIFVHICLLERFPNDGISASRQSAALTRSNLPMSWRAIRRYTMEQSAAKPVSRNSRHRNQAHAISQTHSWFCGKHEDPASHQGLLHHSSGRVLSALRNRDRHKSIRFPRPTSMRCQKKQNYAAPTPRICITPPDIFWGHDTKFSTQRLVFPIKEAPVLATVTHLGEQRDVRVPHKKALVAADTGHISRGNTMTDIASHPPDCRRLWTLE